jgi:hypothetical protein
MEQWYAVIDSRTGEALSFCTEVADPLPDGCAALPIDHQPGYGETWDRAKRAVVAGGRTTTEIRRDRLAELRAKGWQARTPAENDELDGLARDLG